MRSGGRRRRASRGRGRCAGGFTLVELMVVAIALGALAAAIVPRFFGREKKARMARAQADIAALETSLEMFRLDTGRWPTTEEGLRVLWLRPDTDGEKWDGPYVKKPRFKDPWQNVYIYRSPGTESGLDYEIVSYGKDGQEGGEGEDADVRSWIDLEAEE